MKYRHLASYILCLVLTLLTACSDSKDSRSPSPVDNDGDGVLNIDDLWPDNPDLPKVSSLWGAYGEHWSPTSRLPFVAMAGYREGKEAIPDNLPIVANVVDEGAIPDDDQDDTAAFQSAIANARAAVNRDTPGVILVPAGTYNLSDQLHLNTSGMVLRGAGRDQTILRFASGLINDDSTVTPDDEKRRKLVVLGGNYDSSNNLKTGVHWERWNNAYSISLDTAALPERGDMSLQLASPLSDTLYEKLIAQDNRVVLMQTLNYGESTETPKLAAAIHTGDASIEYEPLATSSGGITVSQQFVVTTSADKQTLFLDRPLRFQPSDETPGGGARIALRNTEQSWDTEEIGLEYLTVELPATDWLEHFGTEAQGGIDVLSDDSWVRSVRVINGDNGIETNKSTFNITIEDIVIASTRTPRRSGPPEGRYDAHGHHGITARGRDHLIQNVTLEVSYVHDVTMNNCHGCVVSKVSGDFVNMDHHRQAIYSSIWTDIDLGNPQRMWDSTGNNTEGYNATAYNTYWDIRSDSPEQNYWPEDGSTYPKWGYHLINLVATGIQAKPDFGAEQQPSPYHPDNAHLETMSPDEIWPPNIYEAQHQALQAGTLLP